MARFWNGILAAEPDRSVKEALHLSIEMAHEGSAEGARASWAAEFADLMQQRGITIDLTSPMPLCIKEVKQNFAQCYVDSLPTLQGTKIRSYFDQVRGALTVESYGPATYLGVVHGRSRRRCLAQLRTGSHWLAEETGRWQRAARNQRVCPHCSARGESHVKDVQHAVFSCRAYDDIRTQFGALFSQFSSDLTSFFGQPNQLALAAFARACFRQHSA